MGSDEGKRGILLLKSTNETMYASLMPCRWMDPCDNGKDQISGNTVDVRLGNTVFAGTKCFREERVPQTSRSDSPPRLTIAEVTSS